MDSTTPSLHIVGTSKTHRSEEVLASLRRRPFMTSSSFLRLDPLSYVFSGFLHDALAALVIACFSFFVDTTTLQGCGTSLRAYNCVLAALRHRSPVTTAWGLNSSGVARCGWMLDRHLGFLAHLSLLNQSSSSSSTGAARGVTVGSSSEGCLVLYRWRWLAPLVPQERIEGTGRHGLHLDNDEERDIRVVRTSKTSCSVSQGSEPACPSGVPLAANEASHDVAGRIVQMYHDTIIHENRRQPGHGGASGCGVRIVLSGSPGCGKSMAARIVALTLGATLVAEYRPDCETAMTMLDIVARTCPSADAPVVVVWNEFDQCVQRYRFNCRGRSSVELATKADHCDMMDYLQFQPHVILVMTTNASIGDLRRLDARHDRALLRPGRITALVRMLDASTTRPRSIVVHREIHPPPSPPMTRTTRTTRTTRDRGDGDEDDARMNDDDDDEDDDFCVKARRRQRRMRFGRLVASVSLAAAVAFLGIVTQRGCRTAPMDRKN